MKRLVYLLFIIGIVGYFANSGYCEDKSYYSGFVGAVKASDSDVDLPHDSYGSVNLEYDLGFMFGGAIGTELGNSRLEGEIAYQKSDLGDATVSGGSGTDQDGNLSLSTLVFNYYYDFLKGRSFSPFVTGGIGLGSLQFNNNGHEDSDAVSLYQVGAGVSFSIKENLVMDVRYRYLVTSDAELFHGDMKIDYTAHALLVGIKVRF